uniref:SIAH-type domain-containing protein n=1 Tax=Clastoptera arizonana TaxID=38151 RepID=A0A1B6DXP8_9HEMI
MSIVNEIFWLNNSFLVNLKYRDLQKIAKQLKLPGNVKKDKIISLIQARRDHQESVVIGFLKERKEIQIRKKMEKQQLLKNSQYASENVMAVSMHNMVRNPYINNYEQDALNTYQRNCEISESQSYQLSTATISRTTPDSVFHLCEKLVRMQVTSQRTQISFPTLEGSKTAASDTLTEKQLENICPCCVSDFDYECRTNLTKSIPEDINLVGYLPSFSSTFRTKSFEDKLSSKLNTNYYQESQDTENNIVSALNDVTYFDRFNQTSSHAGLDDHVAMNLRHNNITKQKFDDFEISSHERNADVFDDKDRTCHGSTNQTQSAPPYDFWNRLGACVPIDLYSPDTSAEFCDSAPYEKIQFQKNELIYLCDNHIRGCTTKLFSYEIQDHEKFCHYQKVSCFYEGCRSESALKFLKNHLNEVHSDQIILSSEQFISIKSEMFDNYKKLVILQSYNERLFLITIDYVDGAANISVKFLPDAEVRLNCIKMEVTVYKKQDGGLKKQDDTKPKSFFFEGLIEPYYPINTPSYALRVNLDFVKCILKIYVNFDHLSSI